MKITKTTKDMEYMIKNLLSLRGSSSYNIRTIDDVFTLETTKDYNHNEVLKKIKEWLNVDGRVR